MLKSMTGFGRSEQLIDGFQIKVQVKSVNHRYSDFTIRTPRCYTFLEDKIRQAAMKAISRGKVEIIVNIEQKESDDRVVTINAQLAQNYITALKQLEQFDIPDDVTMTTLSRFNDIFRVEYQEIDEAQMFCMVLQTLKEALDEFISMRTAEGGRLESSIRGHLEDILHEVALIEARSPQCVAEYQDKLRQKLDEVLSGTGIDETRILTEAAIFADKIAVNEETVRLKSHVREFETAMNTEKPIGKKLDFIVQEMNRETNTIGSKANDLEIAKHVVELKSVIEKIREQIQNIE